MGTLTLSELRAEVRSGLGNRTEDEFASEDTRIDRFLNLAQTRMTRRHRFGELDVTEEYIHTFTGTAADDKVIAWSDLTNSNIRGVYSFRVVDGANSQKLTYIPFRLWDRRIPRPESRGTARPDFYTQYSKQFELYPIPGQTYTMILRLATWPTSLTSASQKSDLDEKDDALIAMACYLAFRSLKNKAAADEWLVEYGIAMAAAGLEDQDNPDYDAVPPNRGDEYINEYWADPFQRSAP